MIPRRSYPSLLPPSLHPSSSLSRSIFSLEVVPFLCLLKAVLVVVTYRPLPHQKRPWIPLLDVTHIVLREKISWHNGRSSSKEPVPRHPGDIPLLLPPSGRKPDLAILFSVLSLSIVLPFPILLIPSRAISLSTISFLSRRCVQPPLALCPVPPPRLMLLHCLFPHPLPSDSIEL